MGWVPAAVHCMQPSSNYDGAAPTGNSGYSFDMQWIRVWILILRDLPTPNLVWSGQWYCISLLHIYVCTDSVYREYDFIWRLKLKRQYPNGRRSCGISSMVKRNIICMPNILFLKLLFSCGRTGHIKSCVQKTHHLFVCSYVQIVTFIYVCYAKRRNHALIPKSNINEMPK